MLWLLNTMYKILDIMNEKGRWNKISSSHSKNLGWIFRVCGLALYSLNIHSYLDIYVTEKYKQLAMNKICFFNLCNLIFLILELDMFCSLSCVLFWSFCSILFLNWNNKKMHIAFVLFLKRLMDTYIKSHIAYIINLLIF